MFKKELGLKPIAGVKSSERRKNLDSVCSTYHLDSGKLSKEEKELLMPPTIKQGQFITSQDKGSVITDDKLVPLWFKTRDSQLYPTVYTLWKHPLLLPVIQTHDYVLEEKICGGAPLMLPGCIPPFPADAVVGRCVAVVSNSNPLFAKAVGICEMSLKNIKEVRGTHGVAVRILHYVGDKLYESSKAGEAVEEAAGRIEEVAEEIRLLRIAEEQNTAESGEEGKVEVSEGSSGLQESKSVGDDVGEGKDVGKDIGKVVGEGGIEDMKGNSTGEPVNSTENSLESSPSTGNPVEMTEIPVEIQEKDMKEEEDSNVPYEMSPEDVDRFFERAVMQSIATNTIELPITMSNMMSNYILKSFPSQCPPLSIKKTSWKKAAKFAKAMEKKGYWKTKGKDDTLAVISLAGRDSDLLKNFNPYKVKKAGETPQKDSGSKSNSQNSSGSLILKYVYKPTKKTSGLLRGTGFYEAEDLKRILFEYIEKKDLVNPRNKANILLDDTLSMALSEPVGSFPRAKVLDKLRSNCTKSYILIHPTKGPLNAKPKSGDPAKIHVQIERRGGNKVVSLITNLEVYSLDPQDIADKLRTLCASSTSVSQLKTGKGDMKEVLVQGPQEKNILELLVKQGINPNWIEVNNKVKGKKK